MGLSSRRRRASAGGGPDAALDGRRSDVEASLRRFARGTIVDRRFVGQRGGRNIGDQLSAPSHPPAPVLGDFADHHRMQVPAREDRFEFGLAPALRHEQHPLLRLREQNLVRRQSRLAQRNTVEVEFDSQLAARRHLARRRGKPCRAHVLNRNDRAALHRFQARLDQQFFGKWVADLHGRALGLAARIELGRGEQARAMDSVAPGRRADVHHRIARPPCARALQFARAARGRGRMR